MGVCRGMSNYYTEDKVCIPSHTLQLTLAFDLSPTITKFFNDLTIMVPQPQFICHNYDLSPNVIVVTFIIVAMGRYCRFSFAGILSFIITTKVVDRPTASLATRLLFNVF